MCLDKKYYINQFCDALYISASYIAMKNRDDPVSGYTRAERARFSLGPRASRGEETY